jgi:hypothetical protein
VPHHLSINRMKAFLFDQMDVHLAIDRHGLQILMIPQELLVTFRT